jgi:hypothetical protein
MNTNEHTTMTPEQAMEALGDYCGVPALVEKVAELQGYIDRSREQTRRALDQAEYFEARAESANVQPRGGVVGEVHPDDAAVDAFAEAMKLKLARAREKGRGGWDEETPGMQRHLSNLLRAHVEKGDPVDVANFCMFLYHRGEPIASGAHTTGPVPTTHSCARQ